MTFQHYFRPLTICSQIESQNSIQTRNSFVLTVLAAVYVPGAFVTVSSVIRFGGALD